MVGDIKGHDLVAGLGCEMFIGFGGCFGVLPLMGVLEGNYITLPLHYTIIKEIHTVTHP